MSLKKSLDLLGRKECRVCLFALVLARARVIDGVLIFSPWNRGSDVTDDNEDPNNRGWVLTATMLETHPLYASLLLPEGTIVPVDPLTFKQASLQHCIIIEINKLKT